MSATPTLKLRARIYCGEEIAMGPGKADLLAAIAQQGSISAAGRALGMSYRRAWLLVDAMNRCWRSPLVETVAGGGKDRGARLSQTGQAVLAQYRALQARIAQVEASDEYALLRGGVRAAPLPAAPDPAG
ncbi:winged helix-turn-helix domain-containing protein [Novosphingobium sp. KA1]|uniref:winged helix-turn-helix domain-containing protein n=1 Tax=Novosphingobium sp. (strain KA1) TaxID=164608 RepID=UPI001A8FEE49|nr:LysR family transcriptional regulator [Novosphingobium sp. KA1]QSR17122.1 ModE family transcriptional regulator [Novosphingobium sp. KA1]